MQANYQVNAGKSSRQLNDSQCPVNAGPAAIPGRAGFGGPNKPIHVRPDPLRTLKQAGEEATASRCQFGPLKRGQFDAIRQRMAPPASPRRPIGYQVQERPGVYRSRTERRI